MLNDVNLLKIKNPIHINASVSTPPSKAYMRLTTTGPNGSYLCLLAVMTGQKRYGIENGMP